MLAEFSRQHVECASQRELSVESQQQIRSAKGKMNPLPTQTNAAVSGPVEEIAREERPDIAKDCWIASRVQAMTSIVQSLAVHVEASGIAADGMLPLDNGHACAVKPSELVRRSNACRPGSENDYVRLRQNCARTG